MTLRIQPKSYIPRLLMEPDDTTTVVEESSITLTATGGSITSSTSISLAAVSAFATQWLQIYDEWRLLKVQFRFHSRTPTTSAGAVVMFIERDISDSPVGLTLADAYRQQESQSFRPYDDFVSNPKLTTLEWNPKDPSDFEYQNVTTNPIFELDVVAEGLSSLTGILGTIQVVARIQFRGRNPVA